MEPGYYPCHSHNHTGRCIACIFMILLLPRRKIMLTVLIAGYAGVSVGTSGYTAIKAGIPFQGNQRMVIV